MLSLIDSALLTPLRIPVSPAEMNLPRDDKDDLLQEKSYWWFYSGLPVLLWEEADDAAS